MKVVLVLALVAAVSAAELSEDSEFDVGMLEQDGISLADPESFLELGEEMETDGEAWKRCNFQGDIHTFTDMTNRGNHYFEVMGEREFIALRGPLGTDGKPFMDFQITQVPFQTETNTRSRYYCKPKYPYITIAKDFALKCGDNYLLYQAPKSTYNAIRCRGHSEYSPNRDFSIFYLKGSIKDPVRGNAKVDFDYEGYSPVDFKHLGRRVEFADGSGSFVINKNYCEKGCYTGTRERQGRSGAITGTLYCGGDTTKAARISFNVNPCCGGCFYSNFRALIPPKSLAASGAKVTDQNMRNSFCGGWDKTTAEGTKWQRDHTACSSVSNVEQRRYIYKGSGTGLPGSVGHYNAGHSTSISEFYTRHECIKSFLPYQHESIFRLFEQNTKGKSPRYDAARWTSDGMAEDSDDPAVIDENKLAEAQTQCTALRRTVDNRATEELDEKVKKDKLLLVATKMCTEDVFLGLEWTAADMREDICDNVQQLVDTERLDIYCAQENIKDLDIAAADVTKLGTGDAAATAKLEGLLALYSSYTKEIEQSQTALEGWDDGICTIAALDTKDLNVDCSAHKFTDSRVV